MRIWGKRGDVGQRIETFSYKMSKIGDLMQCMVIISNDNVFYT